MLDKRPYEEAQVEERLHRQYGLLGSAEIIRNARAIQDKAKKEMTFEVAVKKAIEWMSYKYSREELKQIGM